MTHALRVLDARRVVYATHEYRYVDHGGTAEAARQLAVDEHAVVKTLVFMSDPRTPLLVLMHGDLEVSTKKLARAIAVKAVTPAAPAVAERVTGYQVGGISPFGTRQPLDVVVEATVLELPRVYINGGRRGLLVSMDPGVLSTVLPVTPVHVRVD
jgi:Cys-tRNA(Pro) deacylase